MIFKTISVIYMFLLVFVKCQINLDKIFEYCLRGTSEFDGCLKDGFNELKPYFKEGLPDYGIESFDPFFAAEVPYKTRNPLLNFKLILKNVTESGWSLSEVTKVKTDLPKNEIAITQNFPDKRLNGWYEFEGNILGRKVKNSGYWNLTLFDYVQTLTVSRIPAGASAPLEYPPINVKCNLETCKNLELHISNLAGGRTIVENMLDRVINTAWQPGFVFFGPIINELVGTAFTEIFNKNFQRFPFSTVFK